MKPLAIVTGVGPGTGSAIVRRLHAGEYRVAMLARTGERLSALEQELPGTFGVPCDVADASALTAALEAIEAEAGGPPAVVVHNAVGGAFGSFLEIEPEVLERNFQVNVMALLHLARWAAPKMEAAGRGAIVVTGNTSSSMAREMGPRGVHVAFLIIDAVIDLAWTRQRNPEKPDAYFIKPADIADEVWHLIHQPRSAWSSVAEIRPFGEVW
jgi:NAD(P)-dependent dehydrogenase (short-subunit alcohol dehydrogenase family)